MYHNSDNVSKLIKKNVQNFELFKECDIVACCSRDRIILIDEIV